jgi:dTDP-4-dehydrorhamnose reductase
MRVAKDQVLCPTWVEDLASATVALLERGATGLMHVAGPQALSREDFARFVASVFQLDGSLLRGVSTHELGLLAPRPANTTLAAERLTTLTRRGLTATSDALRAMRDSEPA